MAIFENFPYSNFHEINLDWIIKEVKRVSTKVDTVTVDVDKFIEEVLAEVSPEKIEEIVNQWFEDHPEYLEFINRYAQPQDFGAVADGVTDDSAAIAAALATGMDVYFPRATYLMAQPMILSGVDNLNIDAGSATLKYTGEGAAVKLQDCNYCTLDIGKIESAADGIEIAADDDDSYNCTINFKIIDIPEATGTGIHIKGNAGTIRGLRINGGAIPQGMTGINWWIGTGQVDDIQINHFRSWTSDVHYINSASSDAAFRNVIIHDPSYSSYYSTNFVHQIQGSLADWRVDETNTISDGEWIFTTKNHTVRVSSINGDRYWNDYYGVREWIWVDGDFISRLTGGHTISNVNLNTPDLCVPGEYTCISPSGVTNKPTSAEFHMIVRSVIYYYSKTGTNQYIFRIIFDDSGTNTIYLQYCRQSSGTWTYGPWKKLVPTNV